MPPVRATSIAIHGMKILKVKAYKQKPNKKEGTTINSLSRKGVELFQSAMHIRLSVQNRSEDDVHTKILQGMSLGNPLTEEDLSNYRTLDKLDKQFDFATILVSGNQQRIQFNWVQAKRWAKVNNTYIIRWPRIINEKSWKGRPSSVENMARAKQNPCFWEVFVPGAGGYITFNINIAKKLANGVFIEYDSLSFINNMVEDDLRVQLEKAKPGEVITLQERPDYVNVKLYADTEQDTQNTRAKNALKRKQWKAIYGSMVNDNMDTVVVPISPATGFAMNWKNTAIPGAGGFCYSPSRVKLADHFPLELGFSITVHKAQVRTPKV